MDIEERFYEALQSENLELMAELFTDFNRVYCSDKFEDVFKLVLESKKYDSIECLCKLIANYGSARQADPLKCMLTACIESDDTYC